MATFTAEGASEFLNVKPGEAFTYAISNTFVATVLLQEVIGPGAFQTLTTHTSTQSSKTVQNTSASDKQYRLLCSSYTSGTVTYTFALATDVAIPFIYQGRRLGYFDDAGNLVITGGLTNPGSQAITGDLAVTGNTVVTGNVTAARLLSALIDDSNYLCASGDITKKVGFNANAVTATKTVTLVFSDGGSDISITFPSSTGALAALSGAASNGQTFSGSSTTFSNMVTFTSGLKTKVAVTNTANPPTQAEMVTAFGAAATTGAGFVGVLNDNAGGTNEYFVWSDGTNYFYVAGTIGA